MNKPHSGHNAPEEPRFVGPTRPAYSLQVGDRALSKLGILTDDYAPSGPMTPTMVSGQRSPAASPRPGIVVHEDLFWDKCNSREFARLIEVFQEEVESIYPCLETSRLIEGANDIHHLIRLSQQETQARLESSNGRPLCSKDLNIARVAIATAIVIEGHGTSECSTMLVAPVERSALSVLEPSRDLKDLQLLILLSIYYFHSDEDLKAWRTIGLAAREALVIGLHRESTLMETFTDPERRDVAVKVFWTIYILDRRWSFGTSLPFSLVDRDIDPGLPEPGEKCAYLQYMVGYGRLCSDLWDVVVPFNRYSNNKRDEITLNLDLITQDWIESIPSDLRLRRPRLGLAARSQTAVLQRLRALLYLRGNHLRILIYRYYLLSPTHIRSSYNHAWLAVEIAQDSIQVLVHLHESSNIYTRQQAAFNYFLVSALAVLFLAVCNDPETFAAHCKKSLHSAVDLLRYFSLHSWGSQRLWCSIRGIVPRLQRLEARREEDRIRIHNEQAAASVLASFQDGIGSNVLSEPAHSSSPPIWVFADTGAEVESGVFQRELEGLCSDQTVSQDMMMTHDFNEFGNELIGLYEAFENGQVFAAHSGTYMGNNAESRPYSDETRLWH